MDQYRGHGSAHFIDHGSQSRFYSFHWTWIAVTVLFISLIMDRSHGSTHFTDHGSQSRFYSFHWSWIGHGSTHFTDHGSQSWFSSFHWSWIAVTVLLISLMMDRSHGSTHFTVLLISLIMDRSHGSVYFTDHGSQSRFYSFHWSWIAVMVLLISLIMDRSHSSAHFTDHGSQSQLNSQCHVVVLGFVCSAEIFLFFLFRFNKTGFAFFIRGYCLLRK